MASQIPSLNSSNGRDKSDSLNTSSAESTVVGCLDVYIHQASNIHNICIYQKQDVYAKVFLSSDPKNTISTKTINHGGSNPVFNDNLRLNMGTNEFESSLRCEIWMLSRVKNYLEDQLLGFALVPLAEIVAMDGRTLTKKFPLASNDLFDSQAGFVELSLSYAGSLPEVMTMMTTRTTTIPTPTPTSATNDDSVLSSYYSKSDPSEFAKVEFPDLKVDTENQLMVSEFLKIPGNELDSQYPRSPITEASKGVNTIESSFTAAAAGNGDLKKETPASSVSTTNGFSGGVDPTISDSSGIADSTNVMGKTREASEDGEAASTAVFTPPLIKINIQPEQPVVQQEIVDMYMKSMQQFTDSLAKMKLPMDVENGICTQNEALDSSPHEKEQESKENRSNSSSSRLFYGSNAFF